MSRTAAALAACLAVGLAAPARAAEDGKALFAQKCAACHGHDGKGQTPMGLKLGVKDLAREKGESLAEIAKDVEDGRPPKMMPYKGKLTPEQVRALAQYVKEGVK